jgi:hypothetical protein
MLCIQALKPETDICLVWEAESSCAFAKLIQTNWHSFAIYTGQIFFGVVVT